MKMKAKKVIILALASLTLMQTNIFASGPYTEISERVYNTQKTLKYLDYYDGAVNGCLDEKTAQSIEVFQKDKEIEVTGELNENTYAEIKQLESTVLELENKEYDLKIEKERIAYEKEQAELEKKKQEELEKKKQAELEKRKAKPVDWFSRGQYLVPRRTYFKVTDVKTGKTFNVYRMGGTNHADCEPATSKDTAIMKSIYGYWNWGRRPIVIETQNGEFIAASMAGMPHGTAHIGNNGFNGHFDIHFLNSKTHYDPENGVYSEYAEPKHQQAVKDATGYVVK